MNIVLITTGSRSELFNQSIDSLVNNASEWSKHKLTVVLDSPPPAMQYMASEAQTTIYNNVRQQASASRNIGASSIPKYRRQSHIMFCDDDCYFAPGWDKQLMDLIRFFERPNEHYERLTGYNDSNLRPIFNILTGHAHPYNGSEMYGNFSVPLVISTVNMLMPWSLWDDVGFFVEPGGSGGSEDFDYCMRAKAKGYGFAVTEPQVVLHTGITSSSGKPIVGADLVKENNAKLEKIHGLQGKVRYQ